MNSTSATPQSAGRPLSREELTSVKNLFLLNFGNKDFLLGKRQRRAGVPTLLAPLFFLVVGGVIAVLPALVASVGSSPQMSEANILWFGTLVLGGFFVILAAISYRSYQREKRFDALGIFLQGTIISVSTRERTEGMNILLWLLSIALMIMYLLSLFSSNSGGGSAGMPEDFFEVTMEYEVTTPTGKKIRSKAKHNRPDLRKEGLPQAGDPMLLLYIDDDEFKPL